MIVLPAFLFFVMVGVYFALQSKRLLLNPAALFVAVNSITFLGSVPLLEPDIPADAVLAWIYCVSLAAFMLGAAIVFPPSSRVDKKIRGWWDRPLVIDESPWSRSVLVGIGLVSLFITVLYYQAVGYNLFVDSALSYLRTGVGLEDFIGLRLAAYSDDAEYFAPGYVNQFKNTLLPMVVGYFVVRRFVPYGRLGRLSLAGLLAVVAYALLGTGQRGPFLLWAIATTFFALAALRSLAGKTLALRIVVLTIVGYFVSTLFLGRSVQRWEGIGSVFDLLEEMYERVMYAQQIGGVLGFRYVFPLPIEYGAEWVQSTLGILPDHAGSDLAHRVFESQFGSRRGTMPLPIWGSIWHNFGWPGVVIIPIFLGMIFQQVYVRLLQGPRSLLRLLVFAQVTTILGMWISGPPITLVNNGLVAALGLQFLLLVGRRVHRRRQRASAVPVDGRYRLPGSA